LKLYNHGKSNNENIKIDAEIDKKIPKIFDGTKLGGGKKPLLFSGKLPEKLRISAGCHFIRGLRTIGSFWFFNAGSTNFD